MIDLKENEVYLEISIMADGIHIGEAEVELKSHMISKLVIYEPYQNKGYGTEVVRMLTDCYGCNCLWVKAENDRAIHVYEKCGYKKSYPTMYLMETHD